MREKEPELVAVVGQEADGHACEAAHNAAVQGQEPSHHRRRHRQAAASQQEERDWAKDPR